MNMFKPTTATSPEEYINLLQEPRKSDFKKLYDFVNQTLPGEEPFIMSGMIAWKKYHYQTKTREGEWAVILLGSQKNYISLYACGMVEGKYVAEAHKAQLPGTDIGKSCIHIKKIEQLDYKVLKKVILESVKHPLSM